MVDSLVYRLCIQLFVFTILGFVTFKVWRHYCRNSYSFLHYIFLSFLALLLQSAVKLYVYSLRVLGLPELPEAVFPMLDHALKIGWVILLLYAFIVTISGMKFIKQYFLICNLFLMVFISSTVWLNWLHYLDTTSPGQIANGYFWGELVLEGYITLLLLYGVFFARRVHVAMRGSFFLATIILISRLSIHCWGITVTHKHLIWIFVVDRTLLLLFAAILLVAVFRYCKIVHSGIDSSTGSLLSDSGLVRNEV